MNNQIAISLQGGCIDFWQQWQQYQDYLYDCCLKWMNRKPSDVEDALSRAILKPWEKTFGGTIGRNSAFVSGPVDEYH